MANAVSKSLSLARAVAGASASMRASEEVRVNGADKGGGGGAAATEMDKQGVQRMYWRRKMAEQHKRCESHHATKEDFGYFR